MQYSIAMHQIIGNVCKIDGTMPLQIDFMIIPRLCKNQDSGNEFDTKDENVALEARQSGIHRFKTKALETFAIIID